MSSQKHSEITFYTRLSGDRKVRTIAMQNALWFRIIALVAVSTVSSFGGVVTYDFALNTAPLLGHVAGPFSLEFQFNDGNGTGDANNTAILTNFVFGGGGAVGASTLNGGASGNINSSVMLTDSSFFNRFVQQFTVGNQLGFRLGLSTNLDSRGIPDQFTFAILDSTGTELPTQSLLDAFVEINIDSATPLIQTFAGDASRTPAAGGLALGIEAPTATAVNSVPEPSSLAILSSGLISIGFLGWLRERLKWGI